jgi:hypothetical protein
MIYCSKCGQANDDATRVCMSCGAMFNEKGGAAPFTTTTADPAQAGAKQPGSAWTTPLYEPPGYMQPQGGSIMTTGEKRDPVMVLILSFLTCGIYAIYWTYKTGSEMKDALGRDDINPALDAVLSIITCYLWFIYLAYKHPQLLLQLQERAGLPRNDITLVSLILAIVGLSPVSFFMIQSELNNVWDAAGRK